MDLLKNWINPIYLDLDYIENLLETVKSKPEIKYLVLDNFFRTEVIDKFIEEHKKITFSEKLDRYSHDGNLLPYDSSVCFLKPENYGHDLLFSNVWFHYLSNFFSSDIGENPYTEVKLRYHRPNANGFWIHTDSEKRHIVFICYFNKGWKVSDGGLLQLWKVDECECENTLKVFGDSNKRLDCLNNNRLNTETPGGGFPDGKSHDLILVDQILPIYNRVFICDLKANLTFHSVTPSNSRERTGFVQWIYKN
jgi:hypothetical protein